MNIIVKTAEGHIIVRPDTTWERDSEDFFPPEFVNSLSYTPVIFARISKPGRSVAAKFAPRYYDSIGFGILLFPDDLMDGGESSMARASCLDHTSLLPFPLYNRMTLEDGRNTYSIKQNGKEIFSCKAGECPSIEEAIEEATKYVYIRTGDLLAIELQGRKPLCRREEGSQRMEAFWCDNNLQDLSIVL